MTNVPEIQLKPYNLISGFSKQIQSKIGAQEALNVYIVFDKTNQNPPAIYDLPGISQVSTLGVDTTAVCRGMMVAGDNLYAVYGQTVYKIDKNLQAVPLGASLATDEGVVRMAKNENQIIFVDGINGYLWDFTTDTATFPLPRINSDNSFPGQPLDVTNLDGYFIVVEGQSNNWFWSNLNDGSVWDTTNTEKILSQPDTCEAITTINRTLFIFGKTICEPWYDDPVNDDAPFARNNNLIFEFGTPSRGSVVTNFSRCIWLASTKNGVDSIKMSDGGLPQTISPPQLNYVFQEYEREFGVDDSTAMIYKENGHIFYEITFNAANATWVCDLSADDPVSSWFQRIMNNENRFIAEYNVGFNGKHYVGSCIDNRLFEMSSDFGTYDGEIFLREIIGVTLESPTFKKTIISRWQFDMQMGTGSPTGITANPVVYLAISRDAGVTYGNDRTANIGAQGQRRKSLWFNRCGTSQMFTPRLRFYNNVPTTIIGSMVTMQECLR